MTINLALDNALIEEARKVGADTPAWWVVCPKADEIAARMSNLRTSHGVANSSVDMLVARSPFPLPLPFCQRS
jgi:hypothetical protein